MSVANENRPRGARVTVRASSIRFHAEGSCFSLSEFHSLQYLTILNAGEFFFPWGHFRVIFMDFLGAFPEPSKICYCTVLQYCISISYDTARLSYSTRIFAEPSQASHLLINSTFFLFHTAVLYARLTTCSTFAESDQNAPPGNCLPTFHRLTDTIQYVRGCNPLEALSW